VVTGIVVTLLIALAVLVSKTLYHRLPEKAKKVFTSLKNKLMFNSVLRSLLQNFLPLCISSFVTLKYNEPKKSVTAYILLCLLCLCPFLVTCILRIQKHPLGHPKIKAMIGTLYLNLDTTDKPLALLFTPAFLVRRIVFALVAVIAENVLVQLFVTMYASLALIAYYAMVWPMNDTVNNVLQLGNEIFFFACTHMMLTFTDYTTDPVKRHYVGRVYLVILGVNIIVNLVLIAYTVTKLITSAYREYQQKKEDKSKQSSQAPSPSEQTPVVIDLSLPARGTLLHDMLQNYEMSEK